MEPKYLLIVKVPRGLVIRDTPRPQSQGGSNMRSVAVGTSLMCYGIHNIQGVDYAQLVPQNPLKPEWVRVAEADHSIEYVDVIPLNNTDDDNTTIVTALNRIAVALENLRK